MKRFILVVITILLTATVTSAQPNWQDLFNGKDLSGWTLKNGKAKFYPQNNTIVGQTVMGQANSFLCTENQYSDFILEFEMKIDSGLNSGVQIRSQSKKDYKNYRVHGYQVEADTANRAWTAGIYDEARRGWLYPLEINQKARAAFKNGLWNKFRVEAVGSRIRTYVNSILCADLIDNMTPKGFIALQVHSINDSAMDGKKVIWKNLRIITESLDQNLWPEDYNTPQVNLVPNTLSEKEKQQGWKLLFDGKTTANWKSADSDTFPEKGWAVNDGSLIVNPKGSKKGGDIITKQKFKNFQFQLQFKLTKAANSGIKYFINLDKTNGTTVGCEYQILDDKNHPDAKKGINGNRTLASLYDIIHPHNVLGKKVDRKGWNTAQIIVNGNHVEHWLNNLKMLEYERATPQWEKLVQNSKFKDCPEFGLNLSGNILLQDHGDTVYFRSIKIRQLD